MYRALQRVWCVMRGHRMRGLGVARVLLCARLQGRALRWQLPLRYTWRRGVGRVLGGRLQQGLRKARVLLRAWLCGWLFQMG